MRIILFTGKGGVGKSTLSAATAAVSAARGRRTLLVSSDLAHNLSDIFDAPIGNDRKELSPKLWGLEVDILKEIEEHWEPIQEYSSRFFAYFGYDNLVAEELTLLPGMDTLFLLTRILREVKSGDYDTVIVDSPPTAGTLRILTMTDSASNKMNKIVHIERMVLKLIRPVGNRFKDFKAVVPEDNVYDSFASAIAAIGELGELLRNPDSASIRLVLNPNKIALAETKRAYTYFNLFGFPVDAVFINKIFPAELSKGYLHTWIEEQDTQLEGIRRSFLETSLFEVPHLDHEPIGCEQLDELGQSIYGKRAPDKLLSKPRPFRFEKKKDAVVLTLDFPHLEKEDLDIGRKENELIIRAGAFHRVLTLPDTLADSAIQKAGFEKGRLVVRFGRES